MNSQMPDTFQQLVSTELVRARDRFPSPRASLHEAFAILKEEVDELWEAVKLYPNPTREHERASVVSELVQVAAMCQRAFEDCGLDALSNKVVPEPQVTGTVECFSCERIILAADVPMSWSERQGHIYCPACWYIKFPEKRDDA